MKNNFQEINTPASAFHQIVLTFFLCRFTDEDVDDMYREAPIKNGMFDYIEFTREDWAPF